MVCYDRGVPLFSRICLHKKKFYHAAYQFKYSFLCPCEIEHVYDEKFKIGNYITKIVNFSGRISCKK